MDICVRYRTISVLIYLFLHSLLVDISSGLGEVIWAVNCGGDAHTDIQGIVYQKDLLRVGVASDYGRSLQMIQRVLPQDQIIYQTERYHTTNFAYEVPISRDGEYVLVLKFCEVWFTEPNQKVFDVMLNGQVNIVDGLDIFAKVGRGVAYDEMIPFNVKNGIVRVRDETVPLNGKLVIEFVKLEKDNPKVNAIYVMRGTVDDITLLPTLPGMEQKDRLEDEEEDPDDDDSKRQKRRHNVVEPKIQDPYATDDTGSMMLPLVVAVGAFIPLLFCLCKL